MKADFWNISASKTAAEVDIFGVIGDWGTLEESTAAADFIRNLRKIGRVSTLNVHLHSEGGSVWDGMSIYRTLRDFPVASGGEKVVHVQALAASIASVIMLAGDRIEVSDVASVMIHNPMALTAGDERDILATANRLKQAKQQILAIYERRTGGVVSELSAMMDNETWMTGQEIVDRGFADTVKADAITRRIAAGPLRLVKHYKKTPQRLLAKPAPVSADIAARLKRLGIE